MSNESTPVAGPGDPAGRSPSLLNGVVVAFVTALACALVWAAIVVVTHYEIAFVAIGVGLVIGLVLARNASPRPVMAPIAAAFAVFGCVLGDLLSDIINQARFEQVPLDEAFRVTLAHPGLTGQIFSDSFSPLDAVFWAIAAVAAYRTVQRAVTAAIQAARPTPHLRAPDAPAGPAVDPYGVENVGSATAAPAPEQGPEPA